LVTGLKNDGLLFGEFALGSSADRTNPLVGNRFEGRAGGDAVFGITFGGIVDVPADIADILIHEASPKCGERHGPSFTLSAGSARAAGLA